MQITIYIYIYIYVYMLIKVSWPSKIYMYDKIVYALSRFCLDYCIIQNRRVSEFWLEYCIIQNRRVSESCLSCSIDYTRIEYAN
jgi:hypothetical protein